MNERVRIHDVEFLSNHWYVESTLDEAMVMIASGAIMEGKTIMLLQYAALHNLLGGAA